MAKRKRASRRLSRNPMVHSAYIIDGQAYTGDVELVNVDQIKVKEFARPFQPTSTVRRSLRHFILEDETNPDKTIILLLRERTWQHLVALKRK